VTKIAINTCHGEFILSEKAAAEYQKRTGTPWSHTNVGGESRDDPVLIQIIEDLGKDANGCSSDLKIVEIPSDVEWEIRDYDGLEWVAEKHRTWR